MFRIKEGRDNVVLMGCGLGGYGAMYAGLAHADVFGKIAVQSLDTYRAKTEMLEQLIASKKKPQEIVMTWCRHELALPSTLIDHRKESKEVAALLEKKGNKVVKREIAASSGWDVWRTQSGLILETLLPAAQM